MNKKRGRPRKNIMTNESPEAPQLVQMTTLEQIKETAIVMKGFTPADQPEKERFIIFPVSKVEYVETEPGGGFQHPSCYVNKYRVRHTPLDVLKALGWEYKRVAEPQNLE